jgi:hypothetical protein
MALSAEDRLTNSELARLLLSQPVQAEIELTATCGLRTLVDRLPADGDSVVEDLLGDADRRHRPRPPGVERQVRDDFLQLGLGHAVVTDQEIAACTSPATFFFTAGLQFFSAYVTGHISPSSRFAASWKPRVE